MLGLLLFSADTKRKKKVEQEGKQSRVGSAKATTQVCELTREGIVVVPVVVGLRLETMGLPDNMLIFIDFFIGCFLAKVSNG